jgi:polysaccharide biosynthesis protein PslH
VRIFYICQRVPFPPDRGDKIATFNEIRHLAATHDLHVFCLADSLDEQANVAGLQQIAKSVTACPINPLRARARVLRALVAGQPLSVAYHAEPALHRDIRRQYARLNPELVIVYSGSMAQFAEPFGDVPRIMHFAELDSLKWRHFQEHTRPPMRWIYAIEQERLLAYERQIARAFTLSLLCTEFELAEFERLIPGAPAACVRNGVDLEFFRPQARPKRPGGLVFTGVMDYLPNVDAMQWFCDAVLPRVREAYPGVHLTICGSRPSKPVLELGKRAGIAVTGHVPDVRPYLEEAEIAVVPLRIARGIQNKLLEAMAMGLPCITTSVAWRGLGLPDGEGALVADDAAGFAAHVMALLEDAERRRRLGERARRIVERTFSWPSQLLALDRALAQCAPKGPAAANA